MNNCINFCSYKRRRRLLAIKEFIFHRPAYNQYDQYIDISVQVPTSTRLKSYSSTMKKTRLRVTICLVLFVLVLNLLSSVISETTFSLDGKAFPRQIRRPACAYGRCTRGNSNSRRRASAAKKREFRKVRNETYTLFSFSYKHILFWLQWN